MKTQKDVFMASEANQYFSRNYQNYSGEQGNDEIINVLKFVELNPQKVLEIGCSNGKRLRSIQKVFGAECFGIDPSTQATEEGVKSYPGVSLRVGTADELPFENGSFDTIIFGFCLYLCDRNDLFKIAYEADRCLKDEGTLIIKDFYPPFPYKKKYSHCDGIYSFKMDYSRMFLWNPAYSQVANIVTSHSGFEFRDIPDEKLAITILRKNSREAYPEEPFRSLQ